MLYDFCRRLWQDKVLGLLLVLAANSTLLFTAGSILHTYDTSQAFFWLLSLHQSALAMFGRQPRAWYWAGLALGLALLAKYSSLLLPLGLLGFLLIRRDQRFWLRRREPWLAALLALAVFSPNLIWNAGHGWATFWFNLGRAGGDDFNFTLFEFLGAQVGLVGPVLAVLLALGLWRSWRDARSGDDLTALLLWCSLPAMVLFSLLSIQTRVQPNWPAPAYLGALLAAGAALRGSLAGSRAWRRWGLIALVVGYATVALVTCHVPIMRVLQVPGDADPTMKLYGWPGLKPALARELRQWPDQGRPFIFALNYQLASLAAFHAPGQPRTWCLFLPRSKPNAYLLWDDLARLAGRDGLAVVYGRPELEKLFARVEPLRELHLAGPSGQVMHHVNLYRCPGFKGRDFRPDWARPAP